MGAVATECTALGGTIHLHSVRGQGTVVEFRFPAAKMGDGRDTMASVPGFGAPGMAAAG